jgi:hypothetical protein
MINNFETIKVLDRESLIIKEKDMDIVTFSNYFIFVLII